MFYEQKIADLCFAHKYDESPRGLRPEHHFHTEYEMILFLRGDASFLQESRMFELQPGNIILTTPGQHHSITFNSDSPYERYVIRFTKQLLPMELADEFKIKDGCHATDSMSIIPLFVSIDKHMTNYHGEYAYALLKSALLQILYYFVSECKPCDFVVRNQNISKIIDFINRNISTNFSLEDISKQLRFSESSMCQVFQTNMNISIMSYVRKKKILLAESFISQGERPIDIFKKCGFDDYSTFFRSYKKILGHAPSLQNRRTTVKQKKA